MGNLYQQLCEYENLYLAFQRAKLGKRHKEPVARLERNLETELFRLQDELKDRSYRPGQYRSFYRTEAKRRLISAAPFRDRVVHQALVYVIEPIFERRFIFDSYANRKGKGVHRALDRCTTFMRASRYVLPCDIRQFFPSIDHEILRNELARLIDDENVLWLAEQIVATGVGVLDEVYEMHWFAGDDLLAISRPRGLPIGNLTSQFWANVYLNPFDQFVKRELKCRHYVRYVDDFVLFADQKATLHEWREALICFLSTLRLTVHENSAQPSPTQCGLPFLGFEVFPDHRRLKSSRGYYFRRKLRTLLRETKAGEITQEQLTTSVRGWITHVTHGDTWGLRRSVLRSVRLSAT